MPYSALQARVRRFKFYCAHFFEYLRCDSAEVEEPGKSEISSPVRGQELCGTWMLRAKTTCDRTPGHDGDCMTATNIANRREHNRVHGYRQSPESRKKSNRKYRISSCGLTQEQLDRLLAVQQHTCWLAGRHLLGPSCLTKARRGRLVTTALINCRSWHCPARPECRDARCPCSGSCARVRPRA